jgi:hypothetical protein
MRQQALQHLGSLPGKKMRELLQTPDSAYKQKMGTIARELYYSKVDLHRTSKQVAERNQT